MVKKAPAAPADAEADERRRLRSLAFSNGLLQRGDPAAPRKPLAPSSAVARLQGRDIVRRGGQRAAIDESTSDRPAKENAEPLSPKFESDASEDSDAKDENGTQTTSETPSVRQSARTAGRTMKYTELSSGGDSSDNDNEIQVPQEVDDKVTSPAVKNESQSDDTKPAVSSARPIPSKKEALVQATLSNMFKKAEEKKRSTRSPKGSPATKGPAAKKQRASPKEKKATREERDGATTRSRRRRRRRRRKPIINSGAARRRLAVAPNPLRARARFGDQPQGAGRRTGNQRRPCLPRRQIQSPHPACSRRCFAGTFQRATRTNLRWEYNHATQTWAAK